MWGAIVGAALVLGSAQPALGAAVPDITATFATNVAATTASLHAELSPEGADTSYYFEYGTDTSYGTDVPPAPGADAGGGVGTQAMSQELQALQPSTVYHYDVVAENSAGKSTGPDHTFVTQPANSNATLPDGRQYEMVSPPDKEGALILGPGGFSGGGLVESSADGSKFTYVAYSPFGNAQGNADGSQIISTRNAEGEWSSANITTPQIAPAQLSVGGGTEYKAFSEDLSLAMVYPEGRDSLSPLAPPESRVMYLRGAGGFEPLPGLEPGSLADLQPQHFFTFGNVSDDGSRAIWSESLAAGLSGGPIYGADLASNTTVEITNNGIFLLASPDASKVFYYDSTISLNPVSLNEAIPFEYDVATGETIKLTSPNASPDGAYVSTVPGGIRLLHFADSRGPGVFALNNPAQPAAGNGVARVSANGQYVVFDSTEQLTGYDNIVAHGTSCGTNLASNEPLGPACPEVYEYNTVTAETRCVSCDPSGTRPVGSSSVPGVTPVSAVAGGDYYSRVVSNNGTVFFDSSDSLVAHDTNGVEDVYEFEPAGVGNCALTAGCLALISSGNGGQPSTLLDASADGSDVFFLAADELSPEDVDHSPDVYDAHLCSSVAPCRAPDASAPSPCANSDACKPDPAPQPQIFGPSASATFSGSGNLTPMVAVSQAKPLTRAQRLTSALKACRAIHRNKRPRAACESRAENTYGTLHKTKPTHKRRA